MTHQLEIDSVFLQFYSHPILQDVYLRTETGEITGILGRNGSGKSCLLNILFGSLRATSQSIRIDQQSLFDAYKRPDLIRYLPQFSFILKITRSIQ